MTGSIGTPGVLGQGYQALCEGVLHFTRDVGGNQPTSGHECSLIRRGSLGHFQSRPWPCLQFRSACHRSAQSPNRDRGRTSRVEPALPKAARWRVPFFTENIESVFQPTWFPATSHPASELQLFFGFWLLFFPSVGGLGNHQTIIKQDLCHEWAPPQVIPH